MSRDYNYKNVSSENGEFSGRIYKEANTLLTIYCKMNGLNKTHYLNEIVMKDMNEKFKRLLDGEKEKE